MYKSKGFLLIVGLACLALLAVGCKIISGSFLVVENLEFTTHTGFYSLAVDLTDNDVWEDHADEIDDIEVIGFELWITNQSTTAWTYSAYIDEPTSPMWDNAGEVEANATRFFGELSVPAGTPSAGSSKFVSYASSFKYLSNISTLKNLVKKGAFDLYGISTGGGSGRIDSLKLIITVAATD
ncbi:hypothetical protein KQH82_03170 [bacterium]|nr:hypothetical protein [bacterium]